MDGAVNSRVRALGAVRRWTITAMVLSGLATAGIGAGLASIQNPSTAQRTGMQQSPTAPVAPAPGGAFGSVAPARNAPAGALPHTSTRAS
ncbi:hypothetical protein IG195_19260 (plasmid) [Arthrobacter sp. TES]|nr:hypothetical protein M707_23450 [Arthrobacter sp. AK-YN10]QOI65559.1 hypothetical protein IG195_19260 [Arthrobacter sp. TES]GLU61091.1 hypothetical protein Pure01_36040 [Paenarthrobacter ureafaciens]GLU65360.1 hypothetical protein Pure02_36100 [Paenarthrobacter ureafaciens]GLU69747.1 hypothetical protein Pure03_37230 [Paenarthrobacter ureafaciens]